MKKLIWIVLIGPIIGLALASAHVYYLLNRVYEGPTKNFKISQGDTFANINYHLSHEGIITNARLFHYYNRYKGSMTKYKVGTYQIPTGVKMQQVYDILINGTPITINFTIPEGKNMYEIGKMLEEQKIGTYQEFIKLCKDQDFIRELDIKGDTLEGYLYPDTYKFAVETDIKTMIKSMVSLFKKKTQNLDFSKTLLSPHEVIILASIVEKETGAKVERPLIAGVFHNRLRKNMRLQSDPTTIYGIYENYSGNIKKSDLLNKTPYNTYMINGLPVGPISNPGLESIKAVLQPSPSEYLYFVSKNDGTHSFSETYEQHNQYVKELQINRKAREGKSWRDLKQ